MNFDKHMKWHAGKYFRNKRKMQRKLSGKVRLENSNYLGTSAFWNSYASCMRWMVHYRRNCLLDSPNLSFFPQACMGQNERHYEDVYRNIGSHVFNRDAEWLPNHRDASCSAADSKHHTVEEITEESGWINDDSLRRFRDDDDDDDDVEESEPELEVSEEFQKFIEMRLKHKAEIKKEKNRESLMSKEKVKQSEPLDSVPGRDEMNEKRKKEMELLYGNNSAMIHGMETALQLGFLKKCDTFKPTLWPNIPLSAEDCLIVAQTPASLQSITT